MANIEKKEQKQLKRELRQRFDNKKFTFYTFETLPLSVFAKIFDENNKSLLVKTGQADDITLDIAFDVIMERYNSNKKNGPKPTPQQANKARILAFKTFKTAAEAALAILEDETCSNEDKALAINMCNEGGLIGQPKVTAIELTEHPDKLVKAIGELSNMAMNSEIRISELSEDPDAEQEEKEQEHISMYMQFQKNLIEIALILDMRRIEIEAITLSEYCIYLSNAMDIAKQKQEAGKLAQNKNK